MKGKERRGEERRGEERRGKERKGKERKGKERKGKERKGKERKGKERKGKERYLINSNGLEITTPQHQAYKTLKVHFHYYLLLYRNVNVTVT
jgi:hypothetical protein